MLYVNVVLIPDDRLYMSSCKINAIRGLSMLISTSSANIFCASGNHKFSAILTPYSILRINYLLFGNRKSCLKKVKCLKLQLSAENDGKSK